MFGTSSPARVGELAGAFGSDPDECVSVASDVFWDAVLSSFGDHPKQRPAELYAFRAAFEPGPNLTRER